MSLADLRRQPTATKKPPLSLDDFLEGAHRYAYGMEDRPSAVKSPNHQAEMYLEARFCDEAKPLHQTHVMLSEKTREILTKAADATGHSRSRLIRILVNLFDHLPHAEQERILRRFLVR
ncbi:hypothetical protein [Ferrimonas gelatinilytica]|uniref:Uncharacterized protein n=1 Tax=Ferrimonas gelatinilytica TaxID=1255257 RepID=A0ABP9RW95_9GAMM